MAMLLCFVVFKVINPGFLSLYTIVCGICKDFFAIVKWVFLYTQTDSQNLSLLQTKSGLVCVSYEYYMAD